MVRPERPANAVVASAVYGEGVEGSVRLLVSNTGDVDLEVPLGSGCPTAPDHRLRDVPRARPLKRW